MNKDELKMDGQTMNIEQNNLEKLKSVFPDVVSEGVLDIDKLLGLCGAYVDNDFEKYSFSWKGKAESLRLAQKRSTATLRPCKEESVNFDTTKNLYIEGDNLEVLRLLQSSYYRKVKMIYIDPPYNTGKDFVYEDDFKDPIARYKEITEQATKSNPETMGRFHTNWLNMMYPRLRLASNLLSDDGVIFISISDAEFANLKKILDEVFGEENYLGDIIWNSTKSVTNTALLSVSHTYNLIYFKNKEYYVANRSKFRLPDDGEGFSNPDNDQRGAWKADPFQVGGWRPNQQYEITNPQTGKVYRPNPGSSWKNDYNKYQELIKDNRIVFGTTGDSGPQRKRFIWEAEERGKVAKTWWDDVETTTNGTQTIKKLFDNLSLFDNPKPVGLIEKMLQLGTKDNDIVLDFFSGSATTAHAVMQLNAKDNGNRKFILVQLPELLEETTEAYKAGYKNLCEIGKERVRRAGAKIKQENALTNPNLDTGFKVFKLDSSNLAEWDSTPIEKDDYQKVVIERLDAVMQGAKLDRSKMDIVYEVVLKMGVTLDTEIKEEDLNGKKVYVVGDYLLLICLERGMTADDIEMICDLMPAKLIVSDNCFVDSVVMANAYYILKERKIDLTII